MENKNLKKFTDSNFQDEVLSEPGIVLVDFWAEWCGPCQMIGPVIEELSNEYVGKIKIGKLNVDENPNIPAQYGVRGIPSIIIFKNGSVIKELVGFKPKQEFISELDKLVL